MAETYSMSKKTILERDQCFFRHSFINNNNRNVLGAHLKNLNVLTINNNNNNNSKLVITTLIKN